MTDITVFIVPLQLALIPVLIGLNEVWKTLGVTNRWIPLASILVAIGISFIVPGVDSVFQAIIGGLVVGLSAVGLFSGVRATAAK
jgi:ABC-type glycerol-3-phosphate transport system permease component